MRKTKTKYSLILGLVPCIVFEGEDGVIPEKIQLVAKKTKNEISLESFPRKQIEKMRKQKMRTHSKVFRSWEEGRRPSSVGTA